MELKSYQRNAIDLLGSWLKELEHARCKTRLVVESMAKEGINELDDLMDFPSTAWKSFNRKNIDGAIPKYISRTNDSGVPIPHVCLKVPTGGGKTLMGVEALRHIAPYRGLVLWIVPTKAIYDQTLRSFKTHEHPYRATLEHLSQRRLKLLEKSSPFTREDLNNHLCLMILMYQSVNRHSNHEFLKTRQSNEKYRSFFPEADDIAENRKIAKEFRLETVAQESYVKHSLFNVLKIARPTVVLDEAHKTYGSNAKREDGIVSTINSLNPRLVLELSATPKQNVSNILVDISGTALWNEEMIKLPVEIHNLTDSDWKQTLLEAKEKLTFLGTRATRLGLHSARYVRPIALVRVERTGGNQRNRGYLHSEDVKDYLIRDLSVPEHSIRVQSSQQKELAGENLLSESSSVRWIITKDALKEGWDCSFAYILVLLDNTTATTAVTQMVGRVLRQPEAKRIGSPDGALDRCYIYCFNRDVNDAVEGVRRGLRKEGLDELGGEAVQATEDPEFERIAVKRRSGHKKLRIFLPQVLHRRGHKWRPIDYQCDILGELDWSRIDAGEAINLDPRRTPDHVVMTVGLDSEQTKRDESASVQETGDVPTLGYFASRLTDMVPNPWQAARITEDFLKRHRERFGDSEIRNSRRDLLSTLRVRINEAMDQEAERLFRYKVNRNEIQFHLRTSREQLNYEIEKSFEVCVARTDATLQGAYGKEIGRSLFWPIYESDFNGLEKDFALYLDGTDAIHWWHRIAAKREYALQGWRRDLIYPDFVACIRRDGGGLLVLEIKGRQLEGNKDTMYKEKLLQFLEEAHKDALDHGEMVIDNNTQTTAMFRLLFEGTWKEEMNTLLSDKK